MIGPYDVLIEMWNAWQHEKWGFSGWLSYLIKSLKVKTKNVRFI